VNEIIQIFIGSMVVAFSGALAPGPMLTIVISSVSEKGFWSSFFIVAGHSILELFLVIGFVLGIFNYLNNPLLLKIIGVLGGVVLFFIGGNILYSVLKNKVKINFKSTNNMTSIDKKFMGIYMLKGVVVSVINPYWYIWWFSIGMAFLIKSVKFNVNGISSFFVGHISADFIWYMFVGFLISKGRGFLSQKVYKGILILCSLFLFYMGIKFIVDFIS